MTTILGALFAFFVGLAFTLLLAARHARRDQQPGAARIRRGLALMSGLVAASVAAFAGAQWAGPALLQTQRSPNVPPAAAPATRPNRLVIPSLGVNQRVVPIPIRQGSWDVSKLGSDIGQLETTGTQPRSDLALVLTAHVTVSAMERGPFADLQTLTPGDKVTLRLDDGTDYVYAIRDLTTIAAQDVRQLYVRDGELLLLVTCSNYDFLSETYTERLVARAVLVTARPGS